MIFVFMFEGNKKDFPLRNAASQGYGPMIV